VPVPLPLEAGPKMDVKILRRIQKLPEALRCDPMYQNPQYWYHFIA
jgi:hypothetical protein